MASDSSAHVRRLQLVGSHLLAQQAQRHMQQTLSPENIQRLQQWMDSERFKHIKRDYTAADVAKLQPTHVPHYLSHDMSMKAYNIFVNNKKEGRPSFTFGALDPVQVVAMAPFVDTIYVSGWQSASTASTTNEPGPDLADYPYNTVPNKVDQLVKAQEFHDRKQRVTYAKSKGTMNPNDLVDFYRPIIADADTGHGGITAVMKLTKLFIQSGAAGIHLEDQQAGTKKCGHMGGKVLVSTSEHVDRLKAARLQADIMECPLVIVARTDSEAAKYIMSNHDPIDQPFIVGRLQYRKKGDNSEKWTVAGEVTLADAMKKMLEMEGRANEYQREQFHCGWDKALPLAKQILRQYDFEWNPEACRAKEGYYKIKGGVEFSIARGIAFAPYADLLWMETASPVYNQAKQFAEGVHKKHPYALLAYNLSPSFNWDSTGMNDDQIKNYIGDLGKLGFVWQFITLAGFHVNGLAVELFANAYQKDRMIGYVRDVQRKEREHKSQFLKHQQWSGVAVVDEVMDIVTGGTASTKITSEGITEKQFENH